MTILRALRPHTYANRRLAEGDVYNAEKPIHATLLVAFGHATICEEGDEKATESAKNQADSTPNQVKTRKKRGRPAKKRIE